MATTDCSADQLEFLAFDRRRVEGGPTAGRTSTDGGALVLRELAQRTGFFEKLAACFVDHRDPNRIEHTVEEMVSQRVRQAPGAAGA